MPWKLNKQAHLYSCRRKLAGEEREKGDPCAGWDRYDGAKWRAFLGNFVIETTDIYYLTLLFKNVFKNIFTLCV